MFTQGSAFCSQDSLAVSAGLAHTSCWHGSGDAAIYGDVEKRRRRRRSAGKSVVSFAISQWAGARKCVGEVREERRAGAGSGGQKGLHC